MMTIDKKAPFQSPIFRFKNWIFKRLGKKAMLRLVPQNDTIPP
jgi:hypothetical protein